MPKNVTKAVLFKTPTEETSAASWWVNRQPSMNQSLAYGAVPKVARGK
jgi:hypothetical protein